MLINHFWLLPGLIPFASLWHAGLILKKGIYMNMNYRSLTTMYESNFTKMYIFLVEKYFFAILAIKMSWLKAKIVNNTRNTYIWAKILSYIVVR